MTKVKITWKAGGPVGFRKEINNRMVHAGLFLRNTHRENINRAYPPASKAGQYPARRTGRLRDGTLLEVAPNKVSVIDTTPYWIYLFRSGRKMLGDTYKQTRLKLYKIILKGW